MLKQFSEFYRINKPSALSKFYKTNRRAESYKFYYTFNPDHIFGLLFSLNFKLLKMVWFFNPNVSFAYFKFETIFNPALEKYQAQFSMTVTFLRPISRLQGIKRYWKFRRLVSSYSKLIKDKVKL